MAATITRGNATPPGQPGGSASALGVAAAQLIKSGPGLLFTIVNVGSDSGSITILDSATDTGSVLYENAAVAAGASISLYGFPFFNGMYVSAASGGTFNIAFT